MHADTLAQRLGGRPTGTGWIARCPAHDDRHASLSIAEGGENRVLLKCHAGCDVPAIVAALGIEMRDLFDHANDGGAACDHPGMPSNTRTVPG